MFDVQMKRHVFLIGPGGSGKSTVGPLLAAQLRVPFVDLDLSFCREIALVPDFIAQHGYRAYVGANSRLFFQLLNTQAQPAIIALSSGFLVMHTWFDEIAAHRDAVARHGWNVLLLAGASVDEALDTVVERQLGRGFGLERDKFLSRIDVYSALADITINSAQAPIIVAQDIVAALVRTVAAAEENAGTPTHERVKNTINRFN